MAQSRFYSPPANIMPGIMSLGGAMKDRFEKDTAAKEEKANMSEAQRIIEEGTPEDLAVFSVKHPKIAQNIIAANKHKNETTKNSFVDSLKKRLLEGYDPVESHTEHAETVLEQGGEIGKTLEQMQGAIKDPDKAREDDLKALALYDPASFKALQSMKAVPSGKWQPWGFGQMRNTQTGEVKKVPVKPGNNETIRSLLGGGFEIVRGDGVAKPKKFSEIQAKTGGFATRVEASNVILDRLEANPKFSAESIREAVVGAIPGLGNVLSTEMRQEYNQAKGDFITAVLRLESGAAIGEHEFKKEDKKYFPQPGDKKSVIANKKQARARQLRILKRASGGAYEAMRKVDENMDEAGVDAPPVVGSKADYDKLPSGAAFIEDGKQYRKP